jgi:hypothetical protein
MEELNTVYNCGFGPVIISDIWEELGDVSGSMAHRKKKSLCGKGTHYFESLSQLSEAYDIKIGIKFW